MVIEYSELWPMMFMESSWKWESLVIPLLNTEHEETKLHQGEDCEPDFMFYEHRLTICVSFLESHFATSKFYVRNWMILNLKNSNEELYLRN